jgi:hypothetical protein
MQLLTHTNNSTRCDICGMTCAGYVARCWQCDLVAGKDNTGPSDASQITANIVGWGFIACLCYVASSDVLTWFSELAWYWWCAIIAVSVSAIYGKLTE